MATKSGRFEKRPKRSGRRFGERLPPMLFAPPNDFADAESAR
jgi:hypothetical protein